MRFIIILFFATAIGLQHYNEQPFTTVGYKMLQPVTCATQAAVNNRATGNTVPFLAQALEAGRMEVEHGKKARQKAKNARVKAFAEQMIKDHTTSNDEISKLAKANNVAVSDSVFSDPQKLKDPLSQNEGAAFDITYMDMMVEDHRAAVALFERARDTEADAKTRSFAGKTLETLRKHYEQAVSIRTALGNGDAGKQSAR